MRWLYDGITQGNPLDYQFHFCLLSLTVIRTLLNHLGLSPQQP